jgi:hypothetical protein
VSYPYLALGTVLDAVPAMQARGVSEVARSPRGFVTAYRRAGSAAALPDAWRQKRAAFLARHLAQMADDGWEVVGGVERPTRRHLALVAWAYSPTPGKLRSWLARGGPMRRNGADLDVIGRLPPRWRTFAQRHARRFGLGDDAADLARVRRLRIGGAHGMTDDDKLQAWREGYAAMLRGGSYALAPGGDKGWAGYWRAGWYAADRDG